MGTKEIIKKVNDLIWKNEDVDGEFGIWQKYIDFGDASNIEYNEESKSLTVYFEGKAYGDSHTQNGRVTITSSLTEPRFFRNWRGDMTINVPNDYVCNKLAKIVKSKGLEVKNLFYSAYYD